MQNQNKVQFNAFDPDAEIEFSERNLPHWFQVGSAMFVTFRTSDSLPKEVILRLQEELADWLSTKKLPLDLASSICGKRLPNHDRLLANLNQADRNYFRELADRLFHFGLDGCHGKCLLRNQEFAKIVADALLFHDGELYDLDCFVVMPNHVHSIVQFRSEKSKTVVGQSWMRYTARQIHMLTGDTGAFWQAEPFDHLIRSAGQFRYLQGYVASNPVKSKLRNGEYLLWKRPE